MTLTWTEKHHINVHEIDQQHEYFVSLINDMHNALFSGEVEDSVDKTLDRLVKYSQHHFETEELVLKEADLTYLLSRQQEEHEQLLAKLDSLLAERAKDGPKLPLYLDILTFLKVWLIDHLEGIDRECGFALNAQGIY